MYFMLRQAQHRLAGLHIAFGIRSHSTGRIPLYISTFCILLARSHARLLPSLVPVPAIGREPIPGVNGGPNPLWPPCMALDLR
jgi:hypothetical protein